MGYKGNMKMNVEQVLETQFLGETFTHFAVMNWAPPPLRTQWKSEFHNLIETGYIIKVEQRMLGSVYRVAAKIQ